MSQRGKRPTAVSLLLYVPLIAFGVWRLVGTHELGIGATVFAWSLIIVGSVGLLLGLLVRILPATTPEEGAKLLLDQQKYLYAGAHEYRRVTAQAFEGLDINFYETTRTKLETLGFRYLGDVEDLTCASAWPRVQAVLRVMAGEGGTVVAAVYHARFFGFVRLLQFLGAAPRKILSVDLESELSSGRFVCTSNSLESDTTAPFPGISKRRFTMLTPVDVLLELHREHLRDALATEPGAQPIDFASLEQVLESQNRQEMIKSAHKARIGYINERELTSVLGKEHLDETERRVLEEVRAIQAREAGPAASLTSARSRPGSSR